MARRNALAGALVLAVLAAFAYLVSNSVTSRKLHVAPDWVRDGKAISMLRKASTEPAKVDPTLFGQVKISTNRGELKITHPNVSTAKGYPYDVIEVKPGEPFSLGDAELQLVALGVAYPRPGDLNSESARGDRSARVDLDFYNPDLSPMSEKKAHELFTDEWQRKEHCQPLFPEIRLTFRRAGEYPVKLMGIRAHDSTTGASIARGHGSSDWHRMLQVTLQVGLWRSTPVTVALDIAHGQSEEVLLPAVSGTRFTHVGGEQMLIEMLEGRYDGWSSTSNSKSETLTFTHTIDAEKYSTALFLAVPQASPSPFEIDFLDAEGKELPGRGSIGGSNIRGEMFETSRETLKTIRVRPYAKITRVIFELPGIPGLPQENEGVEDLLDVRAPVVIFNGEWHVREFIQHNTQLDVPYFMRTIPAGTFPLARTNLSVREALEMYVDKENTGRRVRIDQRGRQIIIAGSFWEELLQKFKRIFN